MTVKNHPNRATKQLIYWVLLILLLPIVRVWAADEQDEPVTMRAETEVVAQDKWLPPPIPTDDGRLVRYLVHFAYFDDAIARGRALSMFDLTARRKLDEYNVSAEGTVRFQKKVSGSDDVEALELRTARISWITESLQVNVGRFDVASFVSPHSFFGAMPLMGIRRVDGVLAVSSFFFHLGMEEDHARVASPFAVGLFYTPSLFSATWADLDQTQGFVLGQVRIRAKVKDMQAVFRLNVAKTKSDYFDYSSLSSQPSYSLSGEISYKRDCVLSAEYGVQNVKHSAETGALVMGVRVSRVRTWGIFSIDDLALEAQVPVKGSDLNPFTGGSGIFPELSETPKNSVYARVKFRLGAAFLELHATNNRDDYTFGRLTNTSLWIPSATGIGPGRETEEAGLPLKTSDRKHPAYLARVGVAF